MEKKPVFIAARFRLLPDLSARIANLTGTAENDVRIVEVQRDLGGNYAVGFPEASPVRSLFTVEATGLLSDADADISALDASKTEATVRDSMRVALDAAQQQVMSANDEIDAAVLRQVLTTLREVSTENAPKRSAIVPRFGAVIGAIDDLIDRVSKPHPQQSAEARRLVLNDLPSFVYYANYGNLDAEIYLPHVIQNLERTDLSGSQEAKTRTLRVLFDFVKLDPREILELGQDVVTAQRRPTDDEIAAVAEKKKEREILLQSASARLTREFRDWWKQGDYRFRFQADGNHFRIWVSDDRRPEEVELEARSTGLQWFLSFYLVFLVESQEEHKDAILLLDEAGLSLHPLAQKDLITFFEGLADTNQIVYTTHSPFLVDANHLDAVKAVYVGDNGATSVSADLRSGGSQDARAKSIYAVDAALNLRVADTLLFGAAPVVVEGPSDQTYLNAIKTYLIGRGLLRPKREIVFVPAGGVKGIAAIASILAGANDDLPHSHQAKK